MDDLTGSRSMWLREQEKRLVIEDSCERGVEWREEAAEEDEEGGQVF